jgi:hypothetical protein
MRWQLVAVTENVSHDATFGLFPGSAIAGSRAPITIGMLTLTFALTVNANATSLWLPEI